MSSPGPEPIALAAPAPAPHIRVHPAAAGVLWLRTGLRLFARQPLLLLIFVCLGPLLIWSLLLVPVVGMAVALISFPAVSLGMLAVCRNVARGQPPGVACYTAALADPAARWQLLKLGVVYALVVGMLSTLWSLLPLDPGSPAGGSVPGAGDAAPASPLAPTARPGAGESPTGPLQPLALLVKSLILVPLQMALWFAPALCAWHGLPAGKAMFFSFFACWRNLAPIVVLLLSLCALFFVFVVVYAALVAVLGLGDAAAQYLFAPLLLTSWVIAQTSSLAMYQAIVEDREAGSASA